MFESSYDYDYFVYTPSSTSDYYVDTNSQNYLNVNVYSYYTGTWLNSFETHEHGGTVPLNAGQKVYIKIDSRENIAETFTFRLLKVEYSNEPDDRYALRDGPWSFWTYDDDGDPIKFSIDGEDLLYSKYCNISNSTQCIYLNGWSQYEIRYYFYGNQWEYVQIGWVWYAMIKPGEEPYFTAGTTIEGIDLIN